MKKGGSTEPRVPPMYVLFNVKAVVGDNPGQLTEPRLRTTLRVLLDDVRAGAKSRGEQIDGITAFLYQSRQHLAGGSSPLAQAEWWPKGHTFDPANAPNIEDKSTYSQDILVFALPKQVDTPVKRLPKDRRKAIFADLVRLQDRASREAEAKYPTDATRIPMDKLSTYDFGAAMDKNGALEKRLTIEYEQGLLRQYGITKAELQDIQREAMSERWPFPSP